MSFQQIKVKQADLQKVQVMKSRADRHLIRWSSISVSMISKTNCSYFVMVTGSVHCLSVIKKKLIDPDEPFLVLSGVRKPEDIFFIRLPE